jgi:protein SCO1/2
MIITKNKVRIFAMAAILTLSLYSCKPKLPVEMDLSREEFVLINQDSVEVTIPEILKNKISLAGYIFTHCPDICPMTTHNMYRVQKKLTSEEDILFVVISFDPDRDTPSVLKKYAELRDYDLNSWQLLTGKKEEINKLLDNVGVTAIAADSSFTESGELNYYFLHTDRISLVDKEAKVRKNYKGSTADINEIINDIKSLE